MKKSLFIMIICYICIDLCACGQSILVMGNNNAYQTVVEGGAVSPIDRAETISATGNLSGQGSEKTESLVLQSDSQLEEWKQAYLNYLDTLTGADLCAYSLIYVDDDEIPELVIDYGPDDGHVRVDGGCRVILTFHDHVLDEWKPLRSRFTYIERENLICNVSDSYGENERFHSDTVYAIRDGKWVYVGGGNYREHVDTSAISVKMAMLFGGDIDEEKYLIYEYCWDDADAYISEEAYAARLNEIYPDGLGIYPQKYYVLDDICSIIRTGKEK
ncbi:MAG: hypothetical protein K2I96_16815 [Lachnospiraceae bacterium]|nr:hypothetical protein [Lachnospiraceae bacterium]